MSVAGGIDRVGEQRPTWAGTAVTNGAGDAGFSFPVGLFSVAPVLTVSIQETDGAVYFHKVTSKTPTSAVVHVDRSVSVTVLGIGVLAVQTVAAGRTVNLIATVAN